MQPNSDFSGSPVPGAAVPIAIELSDASVTFGRGARAVPALSKTTLRIADGEFVALVGPSGCGKSTILRLVSGLVQPTTGAVIVGGREVAARALRVGMAFQNPTMLPWLTIEQNIMLPLKIVPPFRQQFAAKRKGEFRDRVDALLAQVGLALVLFGLAIWFMRRELVPIEHLGVAADALGKGRDVPDFAFSGGTREVRNAATAFQTMGIRLRRSIQQRTEMLAGVSHDLRTPLTRMKLSLALLPDSPETKELGDDVADMERMIEGYLAFARGEGDEDPVPVDLAEILEDVAAGARRDNANVEVGWRGDMDVELRALAIKRCLTNLVSNALRYGTKARLQAIRGRTSVEITIDDDGPGIPPDRYEDVFRPFFRLDESRNVDTGGVGLGLTIARDVARSHGGDVALAASPLGGLRVIVRIPI